MDDGKDESHSSTTETIGQKSADGIHDYYLEENETLFQISLKLNLDFFRFLNKHGLKIQIKVRPFITGFAFGYPQSIIPIFFLGKLDKFFNFASRFSKFL